MSSVADGRPFSPHRDEESASHIDPDLSADTGQGWVRRFAASLAFLFRCVT